MRHFLVRLRSRFGDLLPECELAETLRPDVCTDVTLPIPALTFPNKINLVIIPKKGRSLTMTSYRWYHAFKCQSLISVKRIHLYCPLIVSSFINSFHKAQSGDPPLMGTVLRANMTSSALLRAHGASCHSEVSVGRLRVPLGRHQGRKHRSLAAINS